MFLIVQFTWSINLYRKAILIDSILLAHELYHCSITQFDETCSMHFLSQKTCLIQGDWTHDTHINFNLFTAEHSEYITIPLCWDSSPKIYARARKIHVGTYVLSSEEVKATYFLSIHVVCYRKSLHHVTPKWVVLQWLYLKTKLLSKYFLEHSRKKGEWIGRIPPHGVAPWRAFVIEEENTVVLLIFTRY